MIGIPRSCMKASTPQAYGHGTKYHCSTHGVEMAHDTYACPLGQLEMYLASQLTQVNCRLQSMENKITNRLVEFGKNLEKLHEQPPTDVHNSSP